MPELPEVETVRRCLVPLMEGKRFVLINIYYPKAFPISMAEFSNFLVGEEVLKCDRKGKYLVFHLSHQKVLISHLRMEGKYLVGDEQNKHDIVRFTFNDNSVLRYNDVRKFGKFEISNEEKYLVDTSLVKLGPEPWEISEKEFYNVVHQRKKPIKECLLDQSVMAGLGNIYADEVLFASKISPLRPASKVSIEECHKLIKTSRLILEEAISRGGATVRSYHPTNGVDGKMQLSLKVYSRAGEPCLKCGFPIKKIKLGGRGTSFCPLCQKEKDKPLIIGIVGSIASGKSTLSNYLAKKGALWIEADAIVHKLYETKEICKKAQEVFGNDILEKGIINRKAMLSKVDAKPPLLEKWNSFLLPLVYKEIERQIEETSLPLVLLDVPLLIGSPFEKECDAIVGVYANEEVIVKRLKERGKNVKEALALASRLPLEKMKKRANFILDGSNEPSILIKQVDALPFMEILDGNKTRN